MGCAPGPVIHSACPGCGRVNSAFMGNSGWGHQMMCCSDECGRRVGAAIKAASGDDRVAFFRRMEEHARHSREAVVDEYISGARVDAGGPEEMPSWNDNVDAAYGRMA